jgi:hypothetical protein
MEVGMYQARDRTETLGLGRLGLGRLGLGRLGLGRLGLCLGPGRLGLGIDNFQSWLPLVTLFFFKVWSDQSWICCPHFGHPHPHRNSSIRPLTHIHIRTHTYTHKIEHN